MFLCASASEGSGRRVRSLQSDRLKPATPAEGASEVFTVSAVLTVLISLRCVRWLGETSRHDDSALALPTSRYEPLRAAYEPPTSRLFFLRAADSDRRVF